LDRGVRHHLLASRAAAPLMVAQGRGLIVATTFWDRDRYLRGNLFYDLARKYGFTDVDGRQVEAFEL
jgi:hypothetical protein